MFVIRGGQHNDLTKMRRNTVTGCSHTERAWAHTDTVSHRHVDRRMKRNLHFDVKSFWEALVTIKKQRRYCKLRGKIMKQK